MTTTISRLIYDVEMSGSNTMGLLSLRLFFSCCISLCNGDEGGKEGVCSVVCRP